MNKHTPGPWQYVSRSVNDIMHTFHGVRAGSFYFDIPTINEKADAILISAAPDLLEALEGMLEIYGVREQHMSREPFASPVEVDCCNQARAAISRARGKRE